VEEEELLVGADLAVVALGRLLEQLLVPGGGRGECKNTRAKGAISTSVKSQEVTILTI
jgi:hypothetical protein